MHDAIIREAALKHQLFVVFGWVVAAVILKEFPKTGFGRVILRIEGINAEAECVLIILLGRARRRYRSKDRPLWPE